MIAHGMMHVYYGNGKGKTTAVIGLALRASGCGLPVVIVQFLKNTASGELAQLARLPGITVLRGMEGKGFAKDMGMEEKQQTKFIHDTNLKQAVDLVESGNCGLLILDEALDAYELELLDQTMFTRLVNHKPDALELAITGHTPIGWVLEKADYVTEMVKRKHPFDSGVKARKGIEF